MNAINAQMQKHFKITAKKKLYFSIAVMFEESRKQVSDVLDAITLLQEVIDKPDAPPEINELAKGAVVKMISALRPNYCLTQAIEGYKQAMGEYPEFVSFLGLKEGTTFSEVANQVSLFSDDIQQAIDKLAAKGKRAPNLKEMAFGKDFVQQCERIKIKGEA